MRAMDRRSANRLKLSPRVDGDGRLDEWLLVEAWDES